MKGQQQGSDRVQLEMAKDYAYHNPNQQQQQQQPQQHLS